MPANNSPTNRAIRRTSALERFKLDPAKATDEKYLERKALEKAALEKIRH
jgi:hypothetical protein